LEDVVREDGKQTMAIPGVRARDARITVQLDEQQYQLLEFLRQEGTWGEEDGEIIRRVVLEQIAEMEGGVR
jgi:hypothetical protein